jgi:hypothetical protein
MRWLCEQTSKPRRRQSSFQKHPSGPLCVSQNPRVHTDPRRGKPGCGSSIRLCATSAPAREADGRPSLHCMAPPPPRLAHGAGNVLDFSMTPSCWRRGMPSRAYHREAEPTQSRVPRYLLGVDMFGPEPSRHEVARDAMLVCVGLVMQPKAG